MLFETPGGPPSHVARHSRFVAEDLTDERILELATRSRKSGAKFTALWDGDWKSHFISQSEADASVICTLAYYTKDAAQLDRLFRGSGLMRDKWDERRGEKAYGQTTIDSALEQVTGQYMRKPVLNTAPQNSSHTSAGVAGELVPLGERDPETGGSSSRPGRRSPPRSPS